MASIKKSASNILLNYNDDHDNLTSKDWLHFVDMQLQCLLYGFIEKW